MSQLDRHGGAGARSAAIELELQRFQAGDRPDALAPELRHLRRAHRPDVRVRQICGDRYGIFADRPQHALEQLIAAVFRDDLIHSVRQPVANRTRSGQRAAVREHRRRDGHIRFGAREQCHPHAPAGDVADDDDEDRDADCHGDVPRADALRLKRREPPLDKTHEGCAETLLLFVHGAADAALTRLFRVRKVRGQDNQRFDPRNQEDRDDDRRDHAEDLADNARHERHRRERDDVGENRERDRHGDVAPAQNGGSREAHPALAILVDVLARHDRVIDDDTQRDDEREHRNHVDRDVPQRQQQNRTEERDRNPHHHPERQAEFKEQAQRQ